MKSKTIVLLVAAIGCGLVASYMTSQLLAQKEAAPEDEQSKVKVLVAKNNIAYGTKFDDPEKFFTYKSFKAGEEPKKAIQSMEEVKDRRATKPITSENFITREDLMSKDMEGLAGKMPHGMRAIAIRVTAESSAAGFVLPDHRVDVLWTIKDGDPQTRTLLEDMLVLAVDTLDSRPDGQKAIVGGNITLMATVEQAEKLTQAQSGGDLRLLLRPFGDKEAVNSRGFKKKELLSGVSSIADKSNEDNGHQGSSGGIASANPKVAAAEPAKPVAPETAKTEDPPAPPEPKYTKFVQTVTHGSKTSTVVRYYDEDGNLVLDQTAIAGLRGQ